MSIRHSGVHLAFATSHASRGNVVQMDVKRVIAAMVAFAFLCGVSRGATGKSPDEIRGTITLTAADRTVLPGAGARVTLRCATDDVVRVGTADDDGAFRFSELPLDT